MSSMPQMPQKESEKVEESESSIVESISLQQMNIASTTHEIELVSNMSNSDIVASVVSAEFRGTVLSKTSDVEPSTSKLPSMTSAKETDNLTASESIVELTHATMSQSDGGLSLVTMKSIFVSSSVNPSNQVLPSSTTSATTYSDSMFTTESANVLPSSASDYSLHSVLFSLHGMSKHLSFKCVRAGLCCH